MAHYGDNKYGNEMKQTDEYGNPIHHTAAGECGGAHAADRHHGAPFVTGATTDAPHHRRSGSSSSSSSEDDGQGGRRKKGIKEKIKEKLPGNKEKQPQPTPAAGYGGAVGESEHEKKGVMDKIKEKLPGQHN